MLLEDSQRLPTKYRLTAMRVAIFSESYEPIINGVSVCVATLRDGLRKRGHEVCVFAPAFRGHKDEDADVYRFPSAHTFFMRDYPFPIPYSPELRRKFESLHFDVVHTQTPFLLGIVGARWARRYGVPLVSTNHTLYTQYAHYVPLRPKALTGLGLIRLMKWYYSGCDALVAPSIAVERILRSYGVRTHVEVIRTGVVAAKDRTAEEILAIRKSHGLEAGDFVLLYVGRIAREKNLSMLLRAFETVSGRHSNARLFLIGGGPALDETKRLATDLGLGYRLRFFGMLSRDEIDPLYASADAFVFPSTTETQGIAICEALSAGLPVVAVNAGGIPENVQHGVDGFLTIDDPIEFADRISFLITHPQERLRMSDAARSNAGSFSVDRMVEDFESFYESVIERAAVAVTQIVKPG